MQFFFRKNTNQAKTNIRYIFLKTSKIYEIQILVLHYKPKYRRSKLNFKCEVS